MSPLSGSRPCNVKGGPLSHPNGGSYQPGTSGDDRSPDALPLSWPSLLARIDAISRPFASKPPCCQPREQSSPSFHTQRRASETDRAHASRSLRLNGRSFPTLDPRVEFPTRLTKVRNVTGLRSLPTRTEKGGANGPRTQAV